MSNDTQQPPEPTQRACNTDAYLVRATLSIVIMFSPSTPPHTTQALTIVPRCSTGDKLFLCVICKKQYSDPSTLLKHQKVTHPGVLFVDANGQETNKRWTSPAGHGLVEAYMDMLRKLWDLLREERLHVEVPEEVYSVTNEDGVTTVRWLDFVPQPRLIFLDALLHVGSNGTPVINTSNATTNATTNATRNDNASSGSNVAVADLNSHSHDASDSDYPSPPGMTAPSTPVPNASASADTSTRSSAEPTAPAGPSTPLFIPPIVPVSSGFIAWTPKDTKMSSGMAEMSGSAAAAEVGGVVGHQIQAPVQVQVQVQGHEGEQESGRSGCGRGRGSNGRASGSRQQVPQLPPPAQQQQVEWEKKEGKAPMQKQEQEQSMQPAQAPQLPEQTHRQQPQKRPRKRRRLDADIRPTENPYPRLNVGYASASDVTGAQGDLLKGDWRVSSVRQSPFTNGPVDYSTLIPSVSPTDKVANDDSSQVPVDQGYNPDPRSQLAYNDDIQYNSNVQNRQSNSDAQRNTSLPPGMN
ncbi:hypothetical protein AX16_001673 [Volvariella volvacea WC 439]|nr:hypothetical protein AX16_001673 [Volvariella volvacea WC 439]